MTELNEYRMLMIKTSLTACHEWTSYQRAEGNEATLDGFLSEFPLYNVPYLVSLLGVEMFNGNDIPTTSQEFQTIK